MGYPDFSAGESANADDLDQLVKDGATVLTSGEAFAIGDALYLSPTDNKLYKADADNANDRRGFVGYAVQQATAADQSIAVRMSGIISGLSLGNATTAVSETEVVAQAGNTGGMITTNPSNNPARQLFGTANGQGNISSIEIYLSTKNGSGNTVQVDVYNVGADGLKTGSSLGSKSLATGSLTANAWNKFTFATAIPCAPRTNYIYEVKGTDGSGVNNWTIDGYSDSSVGTSTFRGGNPTSSTEFIATSTYTFKINKTLTRNWTPGDYAYLDVTAGAIVATEPTSNTKIVGIILSSADVLLTHTQYRGELISKAGLQIANTTNAPVFRFMAPRDWRMAQVMAMVGGLAKSFTIYREGNTLVYADDWNSGANASAYAQFDPNSYYIGVTAYVGTSSYAKQYSIYFYR